MFTCTLLQVTINDCISKLKVTYRMFFPYKSKLLFISSTRKCNLKLTNVIVRLYLGELRIKIQEIHITNMCLCVSLPSITELQ